MTLKRNRSTTHKYQVLFHYLLCTGFLTDHNGHNPRQLMYSFDWPLISPLAYSCLPPMFGGVIRGDIMKIVPCMSHSCFSLFAFSQKTQSFKASLSNSQLIPLKNTVYILHYATDEAAANSLGGWK